MSTENEVLDQKALLVELKNVEESIVQKFDQLNAAQERAQGEVKELGEAGTETKGLIEKLGTEYNELYDRVQQIEQKGIQNAGNGESQKSVGQQFVECDNVKAMMDGRQPSARMDVAGSFSFNGKTAIINATGQNQPLVPADRLGGIAATPNRVLRLRDLLNASPTTSNLIEFTREASFTNNAAGQGAASSPEVYENTTKPESGITFSLVTEAVITLAHWIPASKQVMGDSADLAGHINNRLMYGLMLKEETEMLTGTGANGQLNGLVTQGTAWSNESPNITNEVDIIRSALKQAHVAEYFPDFCVLNPQDWFDIDTRKVGSSDDRYVVGNPRDMTAAGLWGVPIVVSNSITSGTFLVGSSMACGIKDREQASIAISYEEGNNFTKNMVTVLAEERVALCVYRTEAFITGSL